MDATKNQSTTTIQFPVNLNCAHPDSPVPDDEKPRIVDEKDFFADKNRDSKPPTTDNKNSPYYFNVNVSTPLFFFFWYDNSIMFCGFFFIDLFFGLGFCRLACTFLLLIPAAISPWWMMGCRPRTWMTSELRMR